MVGQTPYDENFYRAQKDGSYRSAERAPTFIYDLTTLSDMVFFSAAVPHLLTYVKKSHKLN